MKGFILLMICLFDLCRIHAQEADYYLGRQQYGFIAYDKNTIILPDEDSTFINFYQKFDSLVAYGTGKIQIVHMGGSHIQADIYTHVIRKRMQELTPDMNGGRGLIFPTKMAKTNNPRNFGVRYTGEWDYCKSTESNKTCPIGLTGMSVITTDTIASITIIPNNDSNIYYTYNQVRIFHENTSYHIHIELNNQLIHGYYDTLNRCSVFSSSDFGDSVRIVLHADTPGAVFILQGVSFDFDGPGLVYNAIGVNGAMLSSYLRCELYCKHLKALQPDMIIFSIGTNDAYTRKFDVLKFRQQYSELLNLTRIAAPDAAILLTVPNDSYLYKKYVNGNTALMQQLIFDLARENNCGVWDFYSIMGGLNSCTAWRSLNLMQADKVHFTRNGYELKGELFFSAFLKGWENQLLSFEEVSGLNNYNKNFVQE